LLALKKSGVELFALQEDVQARGLESSQSQAFTNIDYSKFVELSTQHQSVQSWY